MQQVSGYTDIPQYQSGPQGQASPVAYASQFMAFLSTLQSFGIGSGSKAFKVDQSGLWLGADKFADAPFKSDMLGNVTMNSVTINGLSGSVLASAIDSSGNFVNQLISSNLNTQTKQILGEFVFSGAGALAIKTDANNGLWLSPTGILGKKAGATTFAVDNGGNATFGGTLVAASGTFGTVTAGTITGCTFKTATPGAGVGHSIVMTGGSNQDIVFYNDSTIRAYIGALNGGAEEEYLRLEAASGRYVKLLESSVTINGNLNPSTDNVYTLGSSGKRWSEIRGANYYSGDGSQGKDYSSIGFITSIRANGGNLEAKYREITTKDGLVTNIGAESGWNNMGSY